jgi:hypothetical protein
MPTFKPIPGFASSLGGPVSGGFVSDKSPQTRLPYSVNIGGSYNNQYGTAISGGVDLVNRSGNVSAQFPVGDFNNGNYAGVSVGYDRQQGLNAGLTFGKHRQPPRLGPDVYNVGFGFNQPTRFAGQALGAGQRNEEAYGEPAYIPAGNQLNAAATKAIDASTQGQLNYLDSQLSPEDRLKAMQGYVPRQQWRALP